LLGTKSVTMHIRCATTISMPFVPSKCHLYHVDTRLYRLSAIRFHVQDHCINAPTRPVDRPNLAICLIDLDRATCFAWWPRTTLVVPPTPWFMMSIDHTQWGHCCRHRCHRLPRTS
jgi:hypothetical protein